MHDIDPRPRRSPYLDDAPPTSTGRVLLAWAFQHYCAMEWGFSNVDIAHAFAGTADRHTTARVAIGTRVIGETLARGTIRAWARPVGGGEPVELKAGVWELDDFTGRFDTSAIDPKRPFDLVAEPTHWIFLDLEGWNDQVALLVDAPAGTRQARRPRREAEPRATGEDQSRATTDQDRLIRLPEVMHRTGMSRSTIYRRMGACRFPHSVSQSGNIASWRESEVDKWLERPS